MRILGLDIGTKNIGFAISDETGMLAQGKGVIIRISDAAAVNDIEKIIEKNNIGKIVIGLPVNMNGTMGESARSVSKFSKLVEGKTGIPVVLWDERLSTKEVEKVMLAADISRGKRKKVVDKLAAQIILQGYLDSKVIDE